MTINDPLREKMIQQRYNSENAILIVEYDEDTLFLHEMIMKTNHWEVLVSITIGLTAVESDQNLRKKPEPHENIQWWLNNG